MKFYRKTIEFHTYSQPSRLAGIKVSEKYPNLESRLSILALSDLQ